MELFAWQLGITGMILEFGGLLSLFADLFLAKRAADTLRNIREIERAKLEHNDSAFWHYITTILHLRTMGRELATFETPADEESNEVLEEMRGRHVQAEENAAEYIEGRRERDQEYREALEDLFQRFDRQLKYFAGFAIMGATFVLLGAAMQITSAFVAGPG